MHVDVVFFELAEGLKAHSPQRDIKTQRAKRSPSINAGGTGKVESAGEK